MDNLHFTVMNTYNIVIDIAYENSQPMMEVVISSGWIMTKSFTWLVILSEKRENWFLLNITIEHENHLSYPIVFLIHREHEANLRNRGRSFYYHRTPTTRKSTFYYNTRVTVIELLNFSILELNHTCELKKYFLRSIFDYATLSSIISITLKLRICINFKSKSAVYSIGGIEMGCRLH